MDEIKVAKKKGFCFIILISIFAGFIAGAVSYMLISDITDSIASILIVLGVAISYLIVINFTKQTGKLARFAEVMIAFVIYFFAIAFSYATLSVFLRP